MVSSAVACSFRFRFLFACLLLVSLSAASQTPEQLHQLDSLDLVIKTAKHDTTLISAHIAKTKLLTADSVKFFEALAAARSLCEKNLAKKLTPKDKLVFDRWKGETYLAEADYLDDVKRDSEAALKCYKLAEELFVLADEKKRLGYVRNYIGVYYKDVAGNYPEALVYFEQAVELAHEVGDKKMEGGACNNISLIYKSQGRIAEAIDLAMKGLKLAEEAGHKPFQCFILMNLGELQGMMGETEMAIASKTKSLALAQELDHTYAIAGNLYNIGTSYEQLGDKTRALEYMQRGLEKVKTLGPTPFQCNMLNGIGSMYLQLDDYAQAEQFCKEALDLAGTMKNKYLMANGYLNLCYVYLEIGQYDKVLENAMMAKSIMEENGYYRSLDGVYKMLYRVYKKKSLFKEALDMYEKSIAVRDSLNSEDNKKELIGQQYQYEYEKKSAADSVSFAMESQVREAEIARQTAEIKVKDNRQYALAGGLLLVLAFSGFLFNRFRVITRQKKLIEAQKAEVEVQHALAEEQRALVEAKNETIMESITYAKRIQTAILPPPRVVKEFLKDSFILYIPKDIVAGDFYWMEQEGERVMFAAADCTGHGVPGAMVSVICNNGLNRSVREFGLTDPGQILDKTREIVMQEFEKSDEEVKDGMDISLCVMEGNTLHWAGANNPLWIVRGAEVLEFKADKQPIGKYAANQPFTTHTIELQKGDILYSFTDGYQDQFGGAHLETGREGGTKFKAKALKELLLSVRGKDMSEQRNLLFDTFEAWRGELEQVDDVCILGVRV